MTKGQEIPSVSQEWLEEVIFNWLGGND